MFLKKTVYTKKKTKKKHTRKKNYLILKKMSGKDIVDQLNEKLEELRKITIPKAEEFQNTQELILVKKLISLCGGDYTNLVKKILEQPDMKPEKTDKLLTILQKLDPNIRETFSEAKEKIKEKEQEEIRKKEAQKGKFKSLGRLFKMFSDDLGKLSSSKITRENVEYMVANFNKYITDSFDKTQEVINTSDEMKEKLIL